MFAKSQLSTKNFKCFSQSLELFFLTVCQNNFGNKIPFIVSCGVFFIEAKVGSILKGDFKQRKFFLFKKKSGTLLC